MFNFLRRQPVVGIDISDYSIEVLQLNKRKEVLSYARTILEEGIVQDGKILNKEKLVEKLKEVLRDIKAKKAILSLPESKIFIGDFKIIPWQLEEVYTDKINNIQIAAPKKIVDQYAEVIKLVGIEPVVIDIESISLGRALISKESKTKDKTSTMIIDIGARTTNLSIFNSGGVLKNSITVPIAGSHFTKAIADYIKTLKQKNIETEEQGLLKKAEQLKRESGFNPDSRILSILQASFQSIVKEIKEAVSYYENNRGEKIEEIILAGGSALLPKIDEYLAMNLERKVVIGDPLEQIKNDQLTDEKYPPILFANVIGLALRGAGDISKGINLLQQMPSAKKAIWEMPQFSKLQISGLLQNIRKSRVFAMSFIVITFVILGFVVYQNFFIPFIKKTQIEEYSKEPPASNPKGEPQHYNSVEYEAQQVPYEAGKIKVGSPEVEEIVPVSPESELLPEEEDTIEVKEMIVIQDTPTGWLNAREGPDTNYDKVARVLPGESYTLLEENNKWYKIKISEDIEGWITSQYATKQ